MPLLGFVAPRAQVDELFDALDPDGGGAISIDELNKALRRGADASLQMSIPRTASAVARARRNSAKLDVDTSGRGGGTPIAPPTVKFHRSDVVEEKPPPRWDASRSSNGSSSAHAINPERLSEVILALALALVLTLTLILTLTVTLTITLTLTLTLTLT